MVLLKKVHISLILEPTTTARSTHEKCPHQFSVETNAQHVLHEYDVRQSPVVLMNQSQRLEPNTSGLHNQRSTPKYSTQVLRCPVLPVWNFSCRALGRSTSRTSCLPTGCCVAISCQNKRSHKPAVSNKGGLLPGEGGFWAGLDYPGLLCRDQTDFRGR